MGKPIPRRLVEGYAKSFANFPVLKKRGFSIILDISGTVHVKTKPLLKDVDGNLEAGGFHMLLLHS